MDQFVRKLVSIDRHYPVCDSLVLLSAISVVCSVDPGDKPTQSLDHHSSRSYIPHVSPCVRIEHAVSSAPDDAHHFVGASRRSDVGDRERKARKQFITQRVVVIDAQISSYPKI